tara:strand:+ start:12889 stop:13230 length:342 start_codon:yes stop_codon:yes gene_type:complete
MGRINRTQKYAAMWLHSQGWAVSKIANELELTDAQIKNAVKGTKAKDDTGIKTKSAVVSKDPKSTNLMITESNSGSRKVAVMTKAASEQADAIAKQHRDQPSPDNPNIFKPYG